MIIIGKLEALGALLKSSRQGKKLSLAATARPARISPAYLQKLELGSVKNPSPRVLHRVAGVLELSYTRLMELAGYAMPDSNISTEETTPGGKPGEGRLAASIEALSPEEQQAVAAFITYLKAQRKKR